MKTSFSTTDNNKYYKNSVATIKMKQNKKVWFNIEWRGGYGTM